MCRFRFILLLVMATCSMAAPLQAEPESNSEPNVNSEPDVNSTPNVNNEPNPETLLRAAYQKLVDAKAYSADFEFAIRIGMPGLEHGRFARYKMVMARPNRLLFLRTEGDMGTTVVSDGKTLTSYVEELRQYTQSPAPKSLHDYSQSLSGMMQIANGMGGFAMAVMADDPAGQILAGVTESRYLGLENIDGQPCHHLRFIQEEREFDVWVTTGQTPTIRRILPNVLKDLSEEERESGFSIVISIEYKQWNFAPAIDEKTFAFAPPATAQLVDAITAIAPVPPTPPVVQYHPSVGKKAPDFTLPTLEDEGEFHLADAIGKQVIVLDFWASWCPPCVRGLPKLSDVASDFSDRKVLFYAVNLQEDAETIRAFLDTRKEEIDLPVLLDLEATVGNKYSVKAIPQMVLIGLDGRVHVAHNILMGDTKKILSEQIEDLLAGKNLIPEEAKSKEESATDKANKPVLPPEAEKSQPSDASNEQPES